MGLRARTLVCLCGAWLAASCSSEDEGTPAACVDLDRPAPVRAALRSAPSDVRLGGQPLSACLHTDSDGTTLREVGRVYVETAAGLADAAANEPEGKAATQLGYLIGAARRGAAHSQGIADELLRRMEQELLRVDERTRAFVAGERAGRAGG